MIVNQISIRYQALFSSFLCVAGLLALDTTLARAQAPSSPNVGDWCTVPGDTNSTPQGLQDGGGGDWDNSNNNSLNTANTWQMWDGSEWDIENGNVAGVGYPITNTGLITILSGTTITNASASGSTTVADGIIVQSGAVFDIFKGTFTLWSGDSYTSTDLDVFGTLLLDCSASNAFWLNTNATIVVENGGTVTNFASCSGDNFTGPGYTNGLGYTNGGYVANAITFKSGSLFVMNDYGTAGEGKAGTIPMATWNDGSACLIAPLIASNFLFQGVAGQSFYNWTFNSSVQNTKGGGTNNEGSFTVRGNFAIANNNGQVIEDIPGPGYTLTVGGNFGVTNAIYYPTGSPGTATLYIGGNFIVAANATNKINNNTAVGDVIFNGTSPQTLGIYSTLGSPASWNWTVNSGSTVNLDSGLEINTGVSGTAGFLTVNGNLNLTANGSISGTSNIITVAHNATLNVSAGAFTFGSEDILQGAGTITGNVTAGSTSVIHPGTGAALTFDGSLTYSGITSTNIFNLTSSTSGANDQIVVSGGTLTANNAQIVINSGGTLATGDYVLFNVTGGGSISGASTFSATPAWAGTTPANSALYVINTVGNQVLLHYNAPQPVVTSISVSGANLTVHGTSGVPGTYTVLMSTSLATPLSSWTSVGTFTLSSSGSFSQIVNGAVTPGDKAQFFALKAP
jgi:hypothetical protein